MWFKITRTGQHWEDEGSPLEIYNTMLLVRLETFNSGSKETHWLKNFESLEHLWSFVSRHGDIVVSMWEPGWTMDEYLQGGGKIGPIGWFKPYPHAALTEQCVGQIEIYDDYRE